MTYVVVAIPTKDDEERIGTILLKTRSSFSDIIVIDDASDDDTVRIAKAVGADIIRHPVPLGRGAVYRSAIRAAIEKNPEALVVLNGGGGYRDPDGIFGVLDPVIKGEAEVVECRRTGFGAYSGSVLRGLIVKNDRIQLDESLLGYEPNVITLNENAETYSLGEEKSGGSQGVGT